MEAPVRRHGELAEKTMLRMDAPTLRSAAAQLKDAITEHAEWHEDLLRSAFCGLAIEADDLRAFAHRECRFGRWYYERAPAVLREERAFTALGLTHEHMHRIAGRLLRAVAANQPVARTDFEDLVLTGARLRLDLDGLRATIESTLGNRDVLTGAYGRVEMLPELHELRSQAAQAGKPCTIVFMDIDNLKRINDAHGHQVGDAVLSGVVQHLDAHLRPHDKIFRYGGDEFVISLPGADLSSAQAVMTRVRQGLAESLLISGPRGTSLHVTASFGLAMLDPELEVVDSIGRADQALLLAKSAGRNRAICWDESVVTSTRWRRVSLDEVPK
jgi:diguanylate cyclase